MLTNKKVREQTSEVKSHSQKIRELREAFKDLESEVPTHMDQVDKKLATENSLDIKKAFKETKSDQSLNMKHKQKFKFRSLINTNRNTQDTLL